MQRPFRLESEDRFSQLVHDLWVERCSFLGKIRMLLDDPTHRSI